MNLDQNTALCCVATAAGVVGILWKLGLLHWTPPSAKDAVAGGPVDSPTYTSTALAEEALAGESRRQQQKIYDEAIAKLQRQRDRLIEPEIPAEK